MENREGYGGFGMKFNRCFLGIISINFLVILTSILLGGCGIPQEEHQKVLAENQRLRDEIARLNKEIDEYQHGEERTLALIDQAIKNNDVVLARENINLLIEYHPEATGKNEYTSLLRLVEQEEQKIRDAEEAAQLERIRQARLANIGKYPETPITINGRGDFPDNIIKNIILDSDRYLDKYIMIENYIYERFGIDNSSWIPGGSEWFEENETYRFSRTRTMSDNRFTFYFHPSAREGKSYMLELNGKYYTADQGLTITGKLLGIKGDNSPSINYVFIITQFTRSGVKYLGSIPSVYQ
jgi:hypothetical protein